MATCKDCIHYPACKSCWCSFWENQEMTEDDHCKMFKNKADYAEVKHGEWIEYQTPNIICCSECDWGTGVDEKTFKYCPNCGAKMDGATDINVGGKEKEGAENG